MLIRPRMDRGVPEGRRTRCAPSLSCPVSPRPSSPRPPPA